MTVQRYFSTSSVRAARRSFVTGSVLGVGLNLMLLVLGMAILYYYRTWPQRLPEAIDPTHGGDVDRIFPTFVVQQLPPGIAGGILAAMLAAAMSSIDSGVNSIAAVLAVERASTRRDRARRRSTKLPDSDSPAESHVAWARVTTIVAGLLITLAAIGLDRWTGGWNIVDMMPRSFNCFTGSLGGLFLIGLFIRRATWRSAVPATLCGLCVSFAIAYSRELFALREAISFTWVMPGSLLATLVTAGLLSRMEPRRTERFAGLTWYTRQQPIDTARSSVSSEQPVS